MTDNEIIKAVEICASGTCEGCNTKHGYDCVPLDMEIILSLINRQKAEIERLKYCNETNISSIATLHERLKTAKSEAIKEFDERLKEDCLSYPLEKGDLTMLVDVDNYNNLVKETVGDNNE